MKPLKFFEQLGSIEKFRNMINMGRGAISYVNLEQDDPPSKRPACLFVSSSSSYTSPSQVKSKVGIAIFSPDIFCPVSGFVLMQNDKFCTGKNLHQNFFLSV